MLLFSRIFERLWIASLVNVSINLLCGGWVWYMWRPCNCNHRGTTITSAIIFWWVHGSWWYNKCCVGVWVGTLEMSVFVDMTNTLSRIYCFTIFWWKWKVSKSNIFSKIYKMLNLYFYGYCEYLIWFKLSYLIFH